MGEPALQEVRPVLQEGFPTEATGVSAKRAARLTRSVPKAYPKGFPDLGDWRWAVLPAQFIGRAPIPSHKKKLDIF